MMREQDKTIDSLAGTLSTLAQQAGLMGQEIGEHNECVSSYTEYHCSDVFTHSRPFNRLLTDLEQGVDQTENKLGGAMKKMQKFIRDTEGVQLHNFIVSFDRKPILAQKRSPVGALLY